MNIKDVSLDRVEQTSTDKNRLHRMEYARVDQSREPSPKQARKEQTRAEHTSEESRAEQSCLAERGVAPGLSQSHAIFTAVLYQLSCFAQNSFFSFIAYQVGNSCWH